MKHHDRHKRVLEQLLLHGPLSFEQLQKVAKLRRSEDEFGLVLGDLAGWKLIDIWWSRETRFYRIKPRVEARARAA